MHCDIEISFYLEGLIICREQLRVRLEWTVVKSARNMVTNFSATIYDHFITQIFSSSSSSFLLPRPIAFTFLTIPSVLRTSSDCWEGLTGESNQPTGRLDGRLSSTNQGRVHLCFLSFLSRPFFFLLLPLLLLLHLLRRRTFNFFFLFLCEILTCLEDNGRICCKANRVTFAMRKLSTNMITRFRRWSVLNCKINEILKRNQITEH